MKQSPKATKKAVTHHKKTPSTDLRAQELTRLQKKNGKDLPAYFKLNLGLHQNQPSTSANKKLYSNNVSPARTSQNKTPPPKQKIERPTTASSKASTQSKGGAKIPQNDSRRPSSSRVQKEQQYSNRGAKNNETGQSALYSYRASKEDIYAPEPKGTPQNHNNSKQPVIPNFEKRKLSRPGTGDSYLKDYINRFDLYSKRVSKEKVSMAPNEKKKNSQNYVVPTMETNSSSMVYNNPTLQSVLSKVSKYVGKPKTGRVDLQEKQKQNDTGKNYTIKMNPQMLYPSRNNSLNDISNSLGDESARLNLRRGTDAEVYGHIGSRKSSFGHISKGKNSLAASRDNSPRESSQKGNKGSSVSINELKEMLRANKKLVEIVEAGPKFVVNESLLHEERRAKRHPTLEDNDDDFEMIEESMKVYKNLRGEDVSSYSNQKTDHKTQNASTEDDSKNSNSMINKRPVNNLVEVSKVTRCSINLQNSPNTQASRPSTSNLHLITLNKLLIFHDLILLEGDDEKQNKSSHKKGSRSVNIANPVDQMMNGVQLPINLNNIRRERLFTPEISENTSANVSLMNEIQAIRLRDPNKGDSRSTTPNGKFDKPRTEAFKNSQNLPSSKPASQTNVTPQSSEKKIKMEESDDQYLRERLIKLLQHNFKTKGTCPPTSLDYYRLVKMIGKGAFGKVYLAVHLLTGEYVAMKSIEKQYMKDEASKRKIFQEVLILKRCSHKNIIRLLEVFENKKYLFIVQEYAAQGDLLAYVKEKGKLTESEAKGIFKQIIHGVQHCHQQAILHRDIKLDNILIDTNMVVKICDFGVSRFVKKGQLINEQCGTPAYIAPEIIKDKGYEGCFADLWSMGVLLYAMITGTVPFRAGNLEELHYAIIEGTYTCPSYLSEEAKDLISKFLRVNPYTRIDINEADKHPWFNPNRLEDGRSKSIVASTKTTASSTQEYRLDRKRQTVPDVGAALVDEAYNPENSKVINETVLKMVEGLGYPRDYIIQSVQNNSCNHASACFFLLLKKHQLLSI